MHIFFLYWTISIRRRALFWHQCLASGCFILGSVQIGKYGKPSPAPFAFANNLLRDIVLSNSVDWYFLLANLPMCQMHSRDSFPWDQKDNMSTKSSRQWAFKDSEVNQNALREVHTEISQKIRTFSGHLNERRFPNFVCGRGSNTKNLFIMTLYLGPMPQLQRLGVWTGWSIATVFYDIAHIHFDILMCGYFTFETVESDGGPFFKVVLEC